MSPVHGNQGQPFGRPAAPSQNNSQWGQQPQSAQQPHAYPQGYAQPGQPAPQGYGQPNAGGYAQQPAYAAPGGYGADYGQPAAPVPSPTAGRAPASYAPQFEPYTPPAAAAPAPRPQHQPQQAYGQPQGGYAPQGFDYGAPAAPQPQAYGQQGYGGYGAQPAAPHAQPAPPAYAPQNWGQPQPQAPAADPRGFDLGTHQGFGAQQEPSLAPPSQHQQEWAQEGYAPEPQFYGQEGHDPSGDFGPAPADYAQDHNGAGMGFGQAAGGELDQGYVDDEAAEYEAEEAPSRWRRPMMMAAVLAGAILAGGGSMYAYKAVFGGSHAGDPPVVKSASQPTKIKPEDGGGKQFAHTDSKIMGRLGDGSAAPDASAGNAAAGSDVDANGTRKVATLVVGRDGSIQAPQTSDAPAATAPAPVTVPGLTVVDGLGTSRPAPRQAAPQPQQPVAQAEPPAPPAAPKVVNSQKVAKVSPPVADAATGSIEPEAEAAAEPAAAPVAPKPKKPKVAAAAPVPAAPAADAGSTSVATTGSGFVAVLASVPRSTSSRMDALKRFADMQQKYAGVLSGKTPDVAEANLGTKGNYHRLVVGPPGSREQANAVCSQLKSQGYADCWVTSY